MSVPKSLPTSLKDKAVGFLGAGNMGEAIIKGLLQTGLVPASSIAATDARADRLQQMASQYGIRGLSHEKMMEVEEKYDLGAEEMAEGFGSEGEEGSVSAGAEETFPEDTGGVEE